MAKLRVHVLFEHGPDMKPYGCAYIRDLLPFSHPANSDDISLTNGIDYARADVIVVERSWKPGLTLAQAEQLLERVHTDRARLVYSIDDNLLDLESIPVNTRMAARWFCREANSIIVATAPLKERLDHFNKNIFVVPNALDERLFFGEGRRPGAILPKQERTVIGYMGTYTHDADLMLVLQPLRKILRQFRESVEFQIVGGVTDQAIFTAFHGLPLRILRVPVENVAYPNFIPWMKKNALWDVALAPLEDNSFNRTKSDIKFLDYSGLGFPGIYSNVPSYQRTVNHLENGYLAENTPSSWYEAMEYFLNDQQARLRLARSAQETVFSSRTLQHCAAIWKDAILSTANNS
jgi:processive 1,2-diacylglycerol beta-glucosyltransferase